MTLSVVILAAGNGKRMRSASLKILHNLGGIPLIQHVINTAQSLNPDSITIIYGREGEQLKARFSQPGINWIHQPEPKGTGHAVLQALPTIPDDHRVLILYGDVPLVKSETLKSLLATTKANEVGLLVSVLEDPACFGRIIRNQQGAVVAIIEQKDATVEQLKIKEINTGILTATSYHLKRWLPKVKDNNTQGEYYLTDVIAIAVADNVPVHSRLTSSQETIGINDRKELAKSERYYQLQKAYELQLQGVTILDPKRFDCRGEVAISQDVIIDINVILNGKVEIQEGSYIGASSVLTNVKIGKHVTIQPHCVIEDAIIGDGCKIGPFARIRPHTSLSNDVHIGNFVELKNAKIGDQSKVNHLTYLGDTIVGKAVNVGAGTITCNYDGINKFQTIIDDGVFIGSGTELIAPLHVGKNAYIGAGSTITRDAPEEELTIARAKQMTVKGWKKPKKL